MQRRQDSYCQGFVNIIKSKHIGILFQNKQMSFIF